MKYLWKDWAKVRHRIHARRRKVLFLDFDGTLARIAGHPRSVRLEPRTRRLVELLVRKKDTIVVIVSGRSARDLKRYFDIRGLAVAGNHGLELHGSRWKLPRRARAARRLEARLGRLSDRLAAGFRALPGVQVENKGLTLSLHYRRVSRRDRAVFRRLFARWRGRCERDGFVWHAGKKVWDLRPRILWNKGDIVRHLWKRMPDACPIAVGDDRTDEDMFRALRRGGVTVRVRRHRDSLAAYYLRSTKDVAHFLEELCL